ncbi:hypothetical protein [Magnetospirillum sulfuroxidans]|uniref:Secreted protein n=1 Tax=Magnetospirillum sulfuroxidans TaxID=611300 RepID=A0ABS5IBU6_9PROT|nr:hypothetical protein [Magnetospirillum sulfuroxidans]MBR9971900.1 hypothetical protein [Magnetospirillum sulfuroxidans]
MTTTLKTIAVFVGLLLLAGCAANADDTPTKTNAGYGPGWRHEQMMQARANGTFTPGPMMAAPGQMIGRGQGFGPGMRGYGPPVDANGNVDTSKLPAWCPYADQAPATE